MPEVEKESEEGQKSEAIERHKQYNIIQLPALQKATEVLGDKKEAEEQN